MAPKPRQLVTLCEAAEILAVSVKTVRRYIAGAVQPDQEDRAGAGAGTEAPRPRARNRREGATDPA